MQVRNYYSSPNIITMTSENIRHAKHVSCTGGIKDAYKILVETSE